MPHFSYDREKGRQGNILILQWGLVSALLRASLFNRFAKNRRCQLCASPKMRLSPMVPIVINRISLLSIVRIVRTRRGNSIARN